MPHIRDIAYITDLIAQMLQIAEQEVERDGRPGMTQMRVAIDRRPADIQPHLRGMQGFEQLLAPVQRIVKHQPVFHDFMRYFVFLIVLFSE